MSPRPALRIAVLVSGSGSNLQAIIDAARTGTLDAQVIGVISDRPGVLALERARQAGIPAITVDYKACGSREAFGTRLLDELRRLDPQLVVLAGFMRVLGREAVERYRGRLINIHPSLLPAFAGLHTHQRAIDAGCKFAGASVHLVTPDLDAGPIIEQGLVPVLPGDTAQTLAARVLVQEHQIYPKAVRALLQRMA